MMLMVRIMLESSATAKQGMGGHIDVRSGRSGGERRREEEEEAGLEEETASGSRSVAVGAVQAHAARDHPSRQPDQCLEFLASAARATASSQS